MAKRNSNSTSPRNSRKSSAAPEVLAADTQVVNPAPAAEPNSEVAAMDQVIETPAAAEPVAESAPGVTRFVKVGPANKNRATMYGITGRRGSIYVPNTMFPGFDAKQAESFVAPESFEVATSPFVTAGEAKAAKPVSERKVKAAANAAEAAQKLAERIAKAAERSRKDQERLAKLQAKLGGAPAPEAQVAEAPAAEEAAEPVTA